MRLLGPAQVQADALERGVRRTRALLLEAPPGPVVLATQHDPSFVWVALACTQLGRTLLPLDPLAPAREVEPHLAGAGLLALDRGVGWATPPGARRVDIAPEDRPSAWQRLLGRSAPVLSFPGLLAGYPEHPDEALVPVEDERVLLLLRTSGSTGHPRLVPWSAAALAAQQRTLSAALDVGPGDRVLNLLPMHHIDGLVMGLLLAHGAGADLLRVGPRIVEQLSGVLDLAWQERATHLICTPSLLGLLLRLGEDLGPVLGAPHARLVVSTAAPLPDPIWRRVEQVTGRPVVNVYGLTETGNLVFTPPVRTEGRWGTVGRPRDCALQVVGEGGEPVSPGQPGELWLRGPSVMGLYADGSSPLVDGWYPTGDLGVVLPDGAVQVLGRLRGLVSVGGLKVAPTEVERALLEHPAVQDARVFGEPDPIWGERLVAELVGDEVGERALVEHLRARLSEHRIPRELRWVGRLGRGATGKVLGPQADGLPEQVLALAAQVFRVDPQRLSLSARPGDVPGWDSIGHLALVDALERVFGLQLGGRELLRLRCLADVVRLIEARDVR